MRKTRLGKTGCRKATARRSYGLLLAAFAVATLTGEAAQAADRTLSARANEMASDAPIVIEIESLSRTARATAGAVSVQNMSSFGPNWSGGAHLFWRPHDPGRRGERASRLTLTFDVAEAGVYQVMLYSTQAPDYGDARISINGGEAREVVGFSPSVRRTRSALGFKVPLNAGRNELQVELFRKMGASTASFFGLDSLELRPAAGAHAASVARDNSSVRDASAARDSTAARDTSSARRDPSAARDAAAARNTSASAAQADQMTSPGGGLLGQIGKLTFATYGLKLNFDQPGPVEQDSFAASSTEVAKLHFDSPHLAAFEWRWQVSRQPFTSTASLTPANLLGAGVAKPKVFTVDLRKLAAKVEDKGGQLPGANPGPVTQIPASSGPQKKTKKFAKAQPRPYDLYIRVLPLKNGQPAGPPSNTIVAHMKPGKSLIEQQVESSFAYMEEIKQKKKAVNGYKVDILEVKQPLFARSSRWGCVIVDVNPYANYPVYHRLKGYDVGEMVCPPKDPDKMEGGTLDWVALALTGWFKAYDLGVNLWNGIKSTIASEIAGALPCEELGEFADECESFAESAAHAGMNYGLALLGVPPTLPTISQLEGAAEGKAVDTAVAFTCEQMASQGVVCTPEMEEELRKLYQGYVNKVKTDLKHQGQEPHCGDEKTAKELGLLTPVCFANYPGTKVHPAPESIYEPPVVKIRATRTQPAPAFHPQCQLMLRFRATNHWPGGNVPGIASPPVPEKDIAGELYEPEYMPLPVLATSESIELSLTFNTIRLFKLIGGSDPGTFTEWAYLYRAGTGTVEATTSTRDPQIIQSTGGQTFVPCSNPDSESMLLLKQ